MEHIPQSADAEFASSNTSRTFAAFFQQTIRMINFAIGRYVFVLDSPSTFTAFELREITSIAIRRILQSIKVGR
jgi:hypothetical protein